MQKPFVLLPKSTVSVLNSLGWKGFLLFVVFPEAEKQEVTSRAVRWWMPLLTLEGESQPCPCVPMTGLVKSHLSALCHSRAELGYCTRVSWAQHISSYFSALDKFLERLSQQDQSSGSPQTGNLCLRSSSRSHLLGRWSPSLCVLAVPKAL